MRWPLARPAAGLAFHRRFGVLLGTALEAGDLPKPSAVDLSKSLKSAATANPFLLVPWRSPKRQSLMPKQKGVKRRATIRPIVNWEKTSGYERSKPVADWISGYGPPPDPLLHGWVFDLLMNEAFVRLVNDPYEVAEADREPSGTGDRAALRAQLESAVPYAAEMENLVHLLDREVPLRVDLSRKLPALWLGVVAQGLASVPRDQGTGSRAAQRQEGLVTSGAGGGSGPELGQILIDGWARLLLHAEGNEGLERAIAGPKWSRRGKNLYVKWLEDMRERVRVAITEPAQLKQVGPQSMTREQLILTPGRLERWALRVAPLDLADLLIHLQADLVVTVGPNVKTVELVFPADVAALIAVGRSI